MRPKSQPAKIELLVIGYGNTLRSDDAVGQVVAQRLEEQRLHGVRVISRHLLTPELAEPISQARKVVFVDASLERASKVQTRSLAAAESSQILAHTADPRTLLALARDVFGHAPQAWWVTIPVQNCGLGEQLSAKALKGIKEAIRLIEKL